MTQSIIGKTVTARVERVEEYGAYLDHNGAKVLVLITEVSASRIDSLKAVLPIGEVLNVRIVRYVAETHEYMGTMMDLPETTDLVG